MEAIKPFFTVYNLFDRMKYNKDQFPHISDRLDALQELVAFVQQKELDKLSDDVRKAWEKLTTIMESAKEVLTKFEKQHVMTHMVKSSDYKLEFENLNKSLTDAFVTLSGALHVHQEKKTLDQGDMLAAQEKKTLDQGYVIAAQKKQLAEQEKKQMEQDEKMSVQENMLAAQENKLHEQERKLAEQERKLAEQEDKLAEQEDILLRVESQLAYESRAYYCTLQ
ncbi:golgin subfamily A member 6-like protein 22 isoform X2 [Perca flavescens]|nr:golgin subfamily A member 6-like protein 22 isoform X2 [Perca flavescens]